MLIRVSDQCDVSRFPKSAAKLEQLGVIDSQHRVSVHRGFDNLHTTLFNNAPNSGKVLIETMIDQSGQMVVTGQ